MYVCTLTLVRVRRTVVVQHKAGLAPSSVFQEGLREMSLLPPAGGRMPRVQKGILEGERERIEKGTFFAFAVKEARGGELRTSRAQEDEGLPSSSSSTAMCSHFVISFPRAVTPPAEAAEEDLKPYPEEGKRREQQ